MTRPPTMPAPTTNVACLVHSLLSGAPLPAPPPPALCESSIDSNPPSPSSSLGSVRSLNRSSSILHLALTKLLDSALASAHSCSADTLASSSSTYARSADTTLAASIPSAALTFASMADLVTRSISICISARLDSFSLADRAALLVSILAMRNSSWRFVILDTASSLSEANFSWDRSSFEARERRAALSDSSRSIRAFDSDSSVRSMEDTTSPSPPSAAAVREAPGASSRGDESASGSAAPAAADDPPG
mmetsp:Transcript_56139/g.168042  ORF Transcript_56139/g.168042 Transcript_56139/m.168042 type:complete len:249 (+) Transcript_56139:219-965(+)